MIDHKIVLVSAQTPSAPILAMILEVTMEFTKLAAFSNFPHQETGKSYVAPTRGYGGYTHHVTLSVVPIALVSLHSLVSGLGSRL